MKSGFVTLIGRPNVGKSTLLNTIVGEKIAITTDKPQTTRNLIQGIYNGEDTQIVFVDTPGIHKPITKLGNKLNAQAYYSIHDVDVVLFLVDASKELGKGDLYVIDKLKEINKPVFLLINKIDKIPNEEILKKITEYKDLYSFAEIVPISAIKNDNTDRLIEVLKDYLPDKIKYFPDGDKTSSSLSFRICETVREKIFLNTEEEIPYSTTCTLAYYNDKKDIAEIGVDILVDRDALKRIIIGKEGLMLKKIGMAARSDLEKLLGKKVFIELYVKTLKKWRDKEKHLRELGFDEFNV